MSKVFFSVTMSLDGFIAPEFMQLGQPVEKWLGQWMELQSYVFQQRFFRESLKLGDGGETGQDNRILEETYNRTGVSIMGKRMFDGGEQNWPEEAPFHTPVFVLTRDIRSPWERPGGTTFVFVNDGIERAPWSRRALWRATGTSGLPEAPMSSANTSTRAWSMSSRSPCHPYSSAPGYACSRGSISAESRWTSRKRSTRPWSPI